VLVRRAWRRVDAVATALVDGGAVKTMVKRGLRRLVVRP
jgi:hypothetical protein